MRRFGGLWSQVVSFANLHAAAVEALRGKRGRMYATRFFQDLEANLLGLQRELSDRSWVPGSYRTFWIQEPKPRLISAAPFRDRVVHHAIFNVLEPIFRRRMILDTYACIPGRGTHGALARFLGFVRARGGVGVVLKCDIRSYFASVDHAVLLGLVERNVSDPRVLRLVRSLVEHGGERTGRGMPIGNLTSQMFANLYLDPLDHFVKETLRVRHYLRYMDDFLMVLDDKAEARARQRDVEAFLADRLRLVLNPVRLSVTPLSSACDVLGYIRHGDGRLRVRRRGVRRLVRRLPVLRARLDAGVIDQRRVRASLASWLGHAKHADAFRLARALFAERDVRNMAKRLLVQGLGRSDARRLGGIMLAPPTATPRCEMASRQRIRSRQIPRSA